MSPPIDQRKEVELSDLNRRIVERLKFHSRMRSPARTLDLGVGDRVSFHPADHPPQCSFPARYNKKTVPVATESGERWGVSLHLLRKMADGGLKLPSVPR